MSNRSEVEYLGKSWAAISNQVQSKANTSNKNQLLARLTQQIHIHLGFCGCCCCCCVHSVLADKGVALRIIEQHKRHSSANALQQHCAANKLLLLFLYRCPSLGLCSENSSVSMCVCWIQGEEIYKSHKLHIYIWKYDLVVKLFSTQ